MSSLEEFLLTVMLASVYRSWDGKPQPSRWEVRFRFVLSLPFDLKVRA